MSHLIQCRRNLLRIEWRKDWITWLKSAAICTSGRTWPCRNFRLRIRQLRSTAFSTSNRQCNFRSAGFSQLNLIRSIEWFDREKQIAYCPIYKAASTSLLDWLLSINNIDAKSIMKYTGKFDWLIPLTDRWNDLAVLDDSRSPNEWRRQRCLSICGLSSSGKGICRQTRWPSGQRCQLVYMETRFRFQSKPNLFS